jgi:hypothetical protein
MGTARLPVPGWLGLERLGLGPFIAILPSYLVRGTLEVYLYIGTIYSHPTSSCLRVGKKGS